MSEFTSATVELVDGWVMESGLVVRVDVSVAVVVRRSVNVGFCR